MLKFSESIVIPGNAQALFDYTQDYNNRLTWDTFLKEATLLNHATVAAKDVKAWCVAKNGLGMETIYVSFFPPKVAAIKMTRGPYIFRDFAASWRFEETDQRSTQVIFTYSFSLRFPFNMTRSIVFFVLKKNVRQRLLDLKQQFLKHTQL